MIIPWIVRVGGLPVPKPRFLHQLAEENTIRQHTRELEHSILSSKSRLQAVFHEATAWVAPVCLVLWVVKGSVCEVYHVNQPTHVDEMRRRSEDSRHVLEDLATLSNTIGESVSWLGIDSRVGNVLLWMEVYVLFVYLQKMHNVHQTKRMPAQVFQCMYTGEIITRTLPSHLKEWNEI